MALSVKVVFLDEIRRLALAETIDYESLQSQLQSLFPGVAQTFRIQYTDEEGDILRVDSDVQLLEALRFSRDSGNTLRFVLSSLEEAPAAAAAAAAPSQAVTKSCSPMRPIVFDIKSFAKARVKYVALTFNGGPSIAPYLDQTTRILDAMASSSPNRVVGTFFVRGSRIEDQVNPQGPLVESMYVRGHQIGNGGYAGTDYTNRTAYPTEMSIVADIQRNAYSIENCSIPYPRYFRSPNGSSDERLEQTLAAMGLVNTLWSYNSQDNVNISPDLIADGVVAWCTQNDIAIINMTDGPTDQTRTVLAMQNFLPRLQAMGVNFVTVQQMNTLG